MSSAHHRSNVRWSVIAMLMAFSFMNYFNRISMSVAGEEIAADYDLGETELGTVFSALILAYTVCMIPGGWLTDRIGGWRTLIVMGLGTGLFTMVTGLLPKLVPVSQPMVMLAMLWLVRGAMGSCTAPLYPAAGRIVGRWIPFQQRATVNALVTGIAMVGIAITYPLFGMLLSAFGVTIAFLITGSLTALIAAIWLFQGRDQPEQHPGVSSEELQWIVAGRQSQASEDITAARSTSADAQGRRWSNVLHNSSLWFLTISYATVGYIEYLVFYWSDHYFKNVLEFSESGGNVAAMLPPLCMGLCMPLGGWISDRLVPVIGYRLARASVAASGMVGCGVMLATATVVQNEFAIVGCFAASLALIGITEAPAWATAIDLGGRSSASSAAIANTGGNLGGALSPTITPWVSSLLIEQFHISKGQSWAWAMRLACVICILGAVLWIRIDASERTDR